MAKNPEKLGDRIKKLRESKNITQEDLGYAVGLRGRQISRIETNAHKPRTDNLKKIADYFAVDLNWLVGADQAARQIKIDEMEPPYHGWKVWLNTMAPTDLTFEEQLSLIQLRFAGDPEPWRYSAILDQLRGPLGRHDSADDEGSKIKLIPTKKKN